MDRETKRLYKEFNDPAPRNRTLFLTKADKAKFNTIPSLKDIKDKKSLREIVNKIYNCDCLRGMKYIPSNSIDLIFADPPYNIGKNFGNGNKANMTKDEYADWLKEWISISQDILKTTGSIYVCADWRYSGVVQSILEEYFIVKNRITWRREKGRGSKRNWKNNMEDIWFAVLTEDYTFNIEEVKIKKEVIAPYKEDGEPKDWVEEDGERYRMTHPPNIWTDTVVPFWSMHENTPHPTQKPEKILERIIRASSNRGETVLDPFMGSGTTAVVANKTGRNYIGFDINKEYVRLSKKRLSKIEPTLDL